MIAQPLQNRRCTPKLYHPYVYMRMAATFWAGLEAQSQANRSLGNAKFCQRGQDEENSTRVLSASCRFGRKHVCFLQRRPPIVPASSPSHWACQKVSQDVQVCVCSTFRCRMVAVTAGQPAVGGEQATRAGLRERRQISTSGLS